MGSEMCIRDRYRSHVSLNALVLQGPPPAVPLVPASPAGARTGGADAGGGAEAGGGLGEHVRSLWLRGFRTFKLKVGRGTPADEAARVGEAARALHGGGTWLRLDGNRQWTLEQAVDFARALGRDGSLECVEYAEELLVNPAELPELYARTGLRFALDESLSDALGGSAHARGGGDSGVEALDALAAAEPARPGSGLAPAAQLALALLARADAQCGLAAYIVKPSLVGGLGACAALRARARTSGARLVLSSAFESGVALAQLAALAEALADEDAGDDGGGGRGGAPEAHGLNTYEALGADVLCPSFASLVDGAHVRLEACELALDECARELAAQDEVVL